MIKQGVYEYHFKTSFQSRWLFSWIEDTRIKFTLWTHNNVQYVAVAYICKKNVRMRLGMHWILRIILSLVIPFWNNYRIFSHPVHCHWELNKKNGIYAVQFIVTLYIVMNFGHLSLSFLILTLLGNTPDFFSNIHPYLTARISS